MIAPIVEVYKVRYRFLHSLLGIYHALFFIIAGCTMSKMKPAKSLLLNFLLVIFAAFSILMMSAGTELKF